MYLDKIDDLIPGIIDGIAKCEHCPVGAHIAKGLRLAGQKAIAEALGELIAVLFPGCHGQEFPGDNLSASLAERLKETARKLEEQVARALACEMAEGGDSEKGINDRANRVILHLIESLPEVQTTLQSDILAAYEGDPAAKSTTEVVLSYPCFKAIATQRIAHVLYRKDVPLVPRIMTEYAHSQTGIDIHPGAQIGEGFFIDHGTGVVIGETCVIGKNVKLYQGVTLGALSFPKDEEGRLIKGIKRHPHVEDGVTIYSGATVLGDITIGKGSVIGGNVWLTHSVPPYSKVYNQQPTPLIKQADGQWKKADGPWNDPGAGI